MTEASRPGSEWICEVNAMKLGVGLFGANGHQVFDLLEGNLHAELIAIAGMPDGIAARLLERYPGARRYHSLEELALDPDVQLVSLCSSVRKSQAEEAMLCLKQGKHVYAEKPCAMTVQELDRLMATARTCGVRFHEMAGTAFEEPYLSMAGIVRSGALGEIVQVLAQKSYPYFAGRPQDEDVDGGLLCQVGIHAFRMVEHVGGKKITEVSAVQTKLGNPDQGGGLHMAASYMIRLEGGAVATVIANYLNQPGFGLWGNEMLRVFGTKGFVESTDGGVRTRLVIGGEDMGALAVRNDAANYFNLVVGEILGLSDAPLQMEDELHPLRAVLIARESAQQGGGFLPV